MRNVFTLFRMEVNHPLSVKIHPDLPIKKTRRRVETLVHYTEELKKCNATQ